MTKSIAPLFSALALLLASSLNVGCMVSSTEGDEGYGDEIASDDGADELGTADQELKYNYVWICFKGSVSCGATTGDGHYVIVANGACDPNATKPECSGTK